MELLVLSDSNPPGARNSAPGLGLNFHQFVDALARCGLIGFSGQRATTSGGVTSGLTAAGGTSATRDGGGGSGSSRAVVTPQNRSEKLFVAPAAERAHAVFVGLMKLHDRQHVDAKLKQLMHLHHTPTAAANDEGENTAAAKKTTENEKDGGRRGKKTRSSNCNGSGVLQKSSITVTNHTPGRLRGRKASTAAATAAETSKPISSLASIQATTTIATRGRKKP